ncbi:MAG TPA: anti-sigma factor [Chloroflexota bacterium]|jgi:hypothetical protein|nr:anti-sigma factor [Chloroflexota bacterium]
MTHEEAVSVLPDYALGAFAGESEAIDEHVASCALCSAQLARYLETTARLAEAVPMLDPPARLRAAVLSHGAVLRADRRYRRRRWRSMAGFVLPAAAVMLLFIGLAGHTVQQQRQLAATRAELALDGRGLALLTSTETTVQRLEPVNAVGTQAHGHWYHRSGIQTQVLVVEFMPPPPAGEAYFGWLLRADGAVEANGRFTLDSQGYSRLILLGHDGADVRSAIVTLQPVTAASAPAAPVLRWPAG